MINRKAHIDPICLIMMVAVLIVGGVLLSILLDNAKIPMYIIAIFAGLSLLSHLINLFHHGFRPIGGAALLIALIITILLFRFSIGNLGHLSRTISESMMLIVSILLILEVAKLSHL